MIPFITYTNSKCSDVWSIYLDLTNKYYGETEHYFITDSSNGISDSVKTHIYKNSDPYYKSWLELLPTFHSEYFLYMQDDFLLYDYVNREMFKFYLNIMKENPEISCIRLLKSGINSEIPVENVPSLHYVDYNIDYALSMQPTIWKTKDFLKLQETKIQISPWDENKLNGNVLNKLDLISLYHYNGENKRGISHYDSNIFPYVATALVKGKWNTKEYPFLKNILDNYNIDITIRGQYE